MVVVVVMATAAMDVDVLAAWIDCVLVRLFGSTYLAAFMCIYHSEVWLEILARADSFLGEYMGCRISLGLGKDPCANHI